MVFTLWLSGLHEDLTPAFIWSVLSKFGYVDSVCVQRDSRNQIAGAYAYFANESESRMAVAGLDNNFILGCKAVLLTETVFRNPCDTLGTAHNHRNTKVTTQSCCRLCGTTERLLCNNCMTCVGCKTTLPGKSLMCGVPQVDIPEDSNVPGKTLHAAVCPQVASVPPWITPLVSDDVGQRRRLDDVDGEKDGSDGSRDRVSPSGESRAVAGSAASLLLEWSDYGAGVDVVPDRPVVRFQDFSNDPDDNAAKAAVTCVSAATAAFLTAHEPRWEDGFDCLSHVTPCHLGCWNGFESALWVNSGDSGVADLYDNSEPTSDTSSQSDYTADYLTHCCYDGAYAETLPIIEGLTAWDDCTRVRVCYLDSPSLMFLRRVDDEDVNRQLLTSVELAAHTAPPIQMPTVGQPCLAFVRNFTGNLFMAGQTQWCRAVVESVQPPNVKVTLLDYGKVLSIQICVWSLRKMSEELSRIPSRTMRLHAPSVIPVCENVWSTDVICFARQFSRGKTYTLKSVRDVCLWTEHGLDWFSTMEKFEQVAFVEPRVPHIVSPLHPAVIRNL